MAEPDEKYYIEILRGAKHTIRFVVLANGRVPAREDFERFTAEDKDKIARALHLVADRDEVRNDQKLKKEEGNIWGIKADSHIRLACFQDGKDWVITEMFRKTGSRWPPVIFLQILLLTQVILGIHIIAGW